MRGRTIWIAGVCGMVGLVAGRASAPAQPIVVQAAAPARPVTIVAPPPTPAAEMRVEPDDVEEVADEGTDLANVLASLHDEAAAHPDRRAILGHVTDGESNEPAIGATVVATGSNLVGEQVVITDERGGFQLVDLPPGFYRLTIYWNNQTTERTDVASREASVTEVAVHLDLPPPPPPPSEDDYIVNLPTGRTFEAVLGAAGDSQDDEGVSFSSHDTLENTYIIY
ncbi:MAG: carboxypeptidase regulatory-like domain-containing protein [Kofleriaceae bacterium]